MISFIDKLKCKIAPNQLSLNPTMFLKHFAVWILSLVINCFPIALVYLLDVSIGAPGWAITVLIASVKDINFLYVACSGLFILFIEGYIADVQNKGWHKIYQCVILVIDIVLIVTYTIMFAKNKLALISRGESLVSYTSVMILVLFLGIVGSAFLSMEEKK